MRKVLILGKLNDVLKDVSDAIMDYFLVQVCDIRSDAITEMINVVAPELIIISLVGIQEYDMGVFRRLSVDCPYIPVLTIGTESEKKNLLRFYSDRQFENLIRPIDNKKILYSISQRLNLEYSVEGDRVIISERNRRKNILIVDDNPMTLRVINEMLSPEFDVTVATSGIQAMTAIGKKRPDLILLDYDMPVCDGRQTLEMIRADADLSDIPVIFLTAMNDRAHIQSVIGLKPAGYMLKPPEKDKLIAEIWKNL